MTVTLAEPIQVTALVARALEQVGVPYAVGGSLAKDVVVQKLIWYRKGNEVSERQWRDVQGVLRIQGAGLDLAYVRRWAAETSITDLLERALAEAAAR
jgi:hypothetical protein